MGGTAGVSIFKEASGQGYVTNKVKYPWLAKTYIVTHRLHCSSVFVHFCPLYQGKYTNNLMSCSIEIAAIMFVYNSKEDFCYYQYNSDIKSELIKDI